MSSFLRSLVLVSVFTSIAASRLAGEELKQDHFWYRIEVQTGDSTYQCIGSSASDEKELSRQIKEGAAVLLDDAAYIDSNGRIKSWKDWDAKASPRLYVNSRYIILVNPLKGDPRNPGSKK
ncbi:MAG TPA: hypothetical protein VK654_12555 [Nitrospirota bacterium]|nr:hypothetical protein [Nitrospirota bacterium]